LTQTRPTLGPIATVASLPRSAAERFGSRVAVRHREGEKWRERTYAEVVAAIEEIALGWVELGIAVGDRVAILADTRPEWTLSSYGISAAGAVVVPIYPSSSPVECQWVLSNSGARAVVCGNRTQLDKIEEVRAELPELEHVVGIDPDAGELKLEQLRARGRTGEPAELAAREAAVVPADPYTIVYTSGTTGPPKGVVLTHENAMTVCRIVEELSLVEPDEAVYLFLPLAHVFALLSQLSAYDLGTTIVYYSGDTKRVIDEIPETRPTYLPSVPRVFEKLYATAMTKLGQTLDGDHAVLAEAIKLGVEVRRRRALEQPVPEEQERRFEELDEKLFVQVRELFGGRIRQAASGAAPIAPEILEFFYAAGIPVFEGWGMTESTGIGTSCRRDAFKFGTVGRPFPGVELRIAEDGEILMRGPNVFSGYWRDPEATAATLVDGWLHTGDLGEIDEDGYLTITGRKKEIIITAGGKNLAPANLENDLKQCRYISQAVMYGDRRPYPVALIALDPEEIADWARQHGLSDHIGALTRDPAVRGLIQTEVDRVNANYATVEQVKQFTILDHELSVEDGELTPTLKIKRTIVYDRYADLFDAMYE
jgi:long-chain acyl-CoA synthetase